MNRRQIRNLALILGGILLFWLPVEDTSERWVILFSAAICALAAAYFLARPASGASQPGMVSSRSQMIYPLAGALAGSAVTPVALLLMAFKSGLHGHNAPDFTPLQVTSVIVRTPIWMIAGLLIGVGIALYRKIKDQGLGTRD